MPQKIKKTNAQWKKILSPEQYAVMFQCGTEAPFSGRYNDFWEKGTYVCAACGSPLFRSETKYEHGTGWPSFTSPSTETGLDSVEDDSHGMRRIEVRCAVCGAHLGHVFDDGPAPGGRHYCINSAALTFKSEARDKTAVPQIAAFAAGCFWGVEDKLAKVKGVLTTAVGYSGGTTKNPTYEDVCTDRTGHAEAVQLTFDPAQVAYEDLVRMFFKLHDPTQVDRQGPDVGTQYRSVIFYQDDEQKTTAEKVKAELDTGGAYGRPIATRILPASEFYKAEDYHQKYYEKHKRGACSF